MTEKRVLQPGPDHPITVTPNPGRIVVKVAGKVVADTTRALTLQEASYPAVQYIPRADVDMALLQRTDHASYFSIPAGGDRSANAVWSYEHPYPAVAAIQEHVAFYPDRVDSIA